MNLPLKNILSKKKDNYIIKEGFWWEYKGDIEVINV